MFNHILNWWWWWILLWWVILRRSGIINFFLFHSCRLPFFNYIFIFRIIHKRFHTWYLNIIHFSAICISPSPFVFLLFSVIWISFVLIHHSHWSIESWRSWSTHVLFLIKWSHWLCFTSVWIIFTLFQCCYLLCTWTFTWREAILLRIGRSTRGSSTVSFFMWLRSFSFLLFLCWWTIRAISSSRSILISPRTSRGPSWRWLFWIFSLVARSSTIVLKESAHRTTRTHRTSWAICIIFLCFSFLCFFLNFFIIYIISIFDFLTLFFLFSFQLCNLSFFFLDKSFFFLFCHIVHISRPFIEFFSFFKFFVFSHFFFFLMLSKISAVSIPILLSSACLWVDDVRASWLNIGGVRHWGQVVFEHLIIFMSWLIWHDGFCHQAF